jgi:pyruvate formate lyase activating enzyme
MLSRDFTMDVKGYIDVSFVDWDSKVSSVIFLPKCNFRCPFCHNTNLVLRPETLDNVPFEFLESQFEQNRGWVDGICITGGEPTLHADLPELCHRLKEKKFLVKLDTNGTNPVMLKKLLGSKAVDYVAMDIKAPLTVEKYSKATGVNMEKLLENVKESVKTLMQSDIDYEFRTTVVPTIHNAKDIEQICLSLVGCKKYVLQKFDVGIGKTIIDSNLKSESLSEEEMDQLLELAQKHISNTKRR